VETSLNAYSLAIAVAGLAVGFVVFCLVDLVRAEKVRYLPSWAWAIPCLGGGLTIPFGGIVSLVIVKERSPKPPPVPRYFRTRWEGLRAIGGLLTPVSWGT
jgi:hypothetical protein